MDLEGRAPLRDVLVVLPGGRMIGDIPIRDRAEASQALGRARSAALGNRIGALSEGLASPFRNRARRGQGDCRSRTEPHFTALGATPEDENPTPNAACVDAQKQAITISMPAGRLQRRHLPCGESLGLPRYSRS